MIDLLVIAGLFAHCGASSFFGYAEVETTLVPMYEIKMGCLGHLDVKGMTDKQALEFLAREYATHEFSEQVANNLLAQERERERERGGMHSYKICWTGTQTITVRSDKPCSEADDGQKFGDIVTLKAKPKK